MMRKISPCLWFSNEAEEAAIYYASIFKNGTVDTIVRSPEGGRLEVGSVLMASFTIGGMPFKALNGNPADKPFTPASSFTVECEAKEEMNELWENLSKDGGVLMPLGEYPFAKYFGWCADQFGVSWQLKLTGQPQSVVPHLMFVGDVFGRANEAIEYYTSIFTNSEVKSIINDPDGNVMIGRLRLEDFDVTINENNAKHQFTFSDAISYCILCENQEEIDHIWNGFVADGGKEMMCFWLTDKFGVAWQVIPKSLSEIMSDPVKGKYASEAMMKMTKPIISDLLLADEK